MGDPNAPDDETREALAELLSELPDRLRDEADAAVADAGDADELVERLADLRERRGVGGDADGAVSDASSVADLRAELDAAERADGAAGADGDARSAGDDAGAGRDADEADGVFGRVRSTLGGVRDRVTGDDDSSAVAAEGADGDGADSAPGSDSDADSTAATDTASPTLPGIERSRELAADARSTSVPSLDRDVSLPSVDGDRSRGVVSAARDRAGAGVVELKRTVRNADPKQAALWGLATGVTVANPAIAASYSTAALLSGAVLGGSAVGAYTSSRDDTVFDDLDPMLMARRANAGASAGAGARNINGKSVGAMLGASSYLAETLTPEAYAQWVAEADAESVLRGAEAGAGRAAASADFSGARSGAALGGGLGLLYGLASDDADEDEDDHPLRELLDDDLWDEYAGRLGDESGDADRADGAARVESRLADEDGDVGDESTDAGTGTDAREDGDVDISDADDGADATDSEFDFGDGA